MPTTPLTHHEILSLVEPFTRKGRHPDLPASNRLERRLVFIPVERSLEMLKTSTARETLQLDNTDAATYRLTRTLAIAAGLQDPLEARLEIEGKHPGELLASLDSIAPETQFRLGCGFAIAKSYRLLPGADSGAASAAVAQMILTRAAAHLGGLAVTFTAPTMKGDRDGDIELRPTDGDMALPEDLLAVLGRDWGLLNPKGNAWTSSLRLRGGEPERSRRAELKLDEMVEHLAQTLGDAPARFHERLAGARWRVVLHRATPSLLYIALIAVALAASRLNLRADTPARLLIFNAAPLLVVLILSMGKQPRFEIPPIPRRSTASHWRETALALPHAPAPAPAPARQSPRPD